MKKILALTLTGLVALGSTAFVCASAQTESQTSAEQGNLYLVPGTYTANGGKVENTISSGATKLSDGECEEIFTENAYLCTLSAGAELPAPSSVRTDKDGNAFIFNGWWMIVDAQVTYFETVPAVTETTFLYADWRAEISQPKDPIIPDGVVEIEPDHYMTVTRASGEIEKITLRWAYTNMTTAETLGHLYAVELFAQGFELSKGDVITIYTTGLTDDEQAVVSPVMDANNSRSIQLEASGDGSNSTADFLTADNGSQRRDPSLTYKFEEDGIYNIYIKYYGKGSVMAVYMEPKV